MTVRVWNKPQTGRGAEGQTCVVYTEVASYHVGDGYELDLRGIDGKLLASYPPGNWHHVDLQAEAPTE